MFIRVKYFGINTEVKKAKSFRQYLKTYSELILTCFHTGII